MYSVANAATLHSAFEALPALVLPYYGSDGKPMKAHPAWPDFYRIRYLAEAAKGFSDVAKDVKPQRYSQPPNTGVCAYLPLNTDWTDLERDPDQPLMITEGELKAAKACQEGFPAIGLGGVYNFRSSKTGVFWLPELEAFEWARRRVSIVYDSDYTSKPDICAAINVLAEELQARGALVELTSIPDVYDDDRKTGLDDFLVNRSDDELIAALRQSEPLAVSAELWRMNDEVVYVENPGIIVVQQGDQKITPSNFTGHSRWATTAVPERKVKADGTVSYVKASAAPVWMKWPLRRAVAKLTYAPGEPKFTYDHDSGCELYNQWDGWPIEPKKGDVKPWLKLIDFVFEGADKGFVDWFLDWCAYPLQHPGTKMFSAVVVHGRATGTGKSLIGYTLGRIYGKNFTKIENKHLKRDFNGWAENKQFILGDEISGSDKRSEADGMKTVITQEEVSINIKMLPEYTVPDCINYYFTSNHADAFFVEDLDRRYAIHEVVHDEPLPIEFYNEYDEWKRSEAGIAALFHHLLQRDLSKFNPKAPAFKTSAARRMSMHGKSDVAVWCAELKESPDSVLVFGKMRYARDLFTSNELLRIYQSENESGGKVTKNGLARALAAAGFKQVYGGNPVAALGVQGRYFAVRNVDRWLKTKNVSELKKNIELPLVKT